MSSTSKKRNQREAEENSEREESASQGSARGTSRRQSRSAADRQTQATEERPRAVQRRDDREQQANGEAERRPSDYGAVFRASAAIRVERLRLARRWREAGMPYSAIYAYTQILERYPDTGVANAAIEELLDMAKELAEENKYYTALGIFNRIEELV